MGGTAEEERGLRGMGVEVEKRLVIRPEHREPDLVQVADVVVSSVHAEAFHIDAALPRSWARVCDLPVGGLDGHVTAERHDGGVVVGGRPVTWLAIPVVRFDLAWSRAMVG